MIWATTEVSLQLTTTGCEQTCIKYTDKDSSCTSSILIDGKENSKKRDGFNVAVIDNISGGIRTFHFRWSYREVNEEKAKMQTFFRQIKTNSIVIIVFQNMCSYFHKEWYRFLYAHGIKLKMPTNSGYLIATVVGCKGSCPQAAKGSIALPYSYTGSNKREKTDITFKLGTSCLKRSGCMYDDSNESNTDSGKTVSIVMVAAPVGGVVGSAIAFLVCVYLYRRTQQHKHKEKLMHHSERSNGAGGGGGACSEPLYEELDNVKIQDEKSNIYIDRSDMGHSIDNNVPLTSQISVTNQPSAPPLYLYDT